MPQVIDPKNVVWDSPTIPPADGIVWDTPEESFLDKIKIPAKAIGMMAKDAAVTAGATIPETAGAILNMHPWIKGVVPLQYALSKGLANIKKAENENSDLKDYPYLQAGIKGAAAGGVFAPTATTMAPGAVAGISAGLASEASDNFLGPILKDYPKLRQGANFLAGGLAGGATGWALGPKQSVAQQDIRRELKDLSPADWAVAQTNANKFDAVGATSATAADTFANRSGIVGLADRTANSRGGEALKTRLDGRETELITLGKKYADNIGPETNSSEVANRVADAANGFMQGTIQQVKDGLRNRLAGKTLTPQEAQGLRYELLHRAQLEKDTVKRQAFIDLAENLTQTDGLPKRSVQEAGLEIRAMRDSVKNPLDTSRGASQIIKNKSRDAYKAANAKLEEYSPDYKEGQADFKAGMQAEGTLKEGPFGRLVDGNPNLERPTPLARLEAVLTGNDPNTIKGTARVLSDPFMTDKTGSAGYGTTVSPLEIARSLVQERMKSGQLAPNGDPNWLGSLDNRRVNALLEAGGKNPADVQLPLEVQKQLSGLGSAPGSSGLPRPTFAQLIRPFRTLDMALTARNQEAVTREVAQLLLDPKNLPELQKIAQFDPSVRKALTLSSAIMPALGTGMARGDN